MFIKRLQREDILLILIYKDSEIQTLQLVDMNGGYMNGTVSNDNKGNLREMSLMHYHFAIAR